MSRVLAEKLRTALDLHDAGVALMRQNLRRQYPAASEREVDARLATWLATRPGATFGDGEGRQIAWPRPRR